MIRLGGPVYSASQDPVELAAAHRANGYAAAYCPPVDIDNADRIRAFREAYAAAGVVIAEAGAWCNMISPDPRQRRTNLDHVQRQLALADELGALCCVDYLGTFDPDSGFGPHPDNLTDRGFDAAVEIVRGVIDAVKPRRAKFCLEMMQWVLPDSIEAYVRLIEAIDRPAFGVHLDPVNIILTPRMYYDTGAVIRECFDKLGPWIASCHAKDIILRGELALHMDEIRIGLGAMDYATYLVELDRHPACPPLMLEHLATEQEYAAAREHLHGIAREAGLAFT